MRDELQTLLGGINATEGPKLPEIDGNSAPFFGRGADLAVLRRVMHAVRAKSECRAVTVVGAPGIGKSRLIDEFIREVAQLDKPAVRTFRSIAPADGSSWSCFTQLFAQRFEIADSAGVEDAKVSVHKQVAQVLDDRKVGDVLNLLGDLLGLEFPKSPVTRAFGEGAPETDVVRRAILKSFLDADAARGPLCLVFDDLHLAKAPTLDMMRSLVEGLKAPVLFLCAARPELLGRQEALPLHDAHTVLHLDPLTALDSAALIGSKLTPEGMTPMHLVEKTRAVTGGNPGRIEEVARVYRDKGTLPPPPDTPDAAVETRLEDLAADERRLLQKAAVMGGVFWLGGLIVLDRADRPSPDVWNSGEDPGLPELTDCLARLTERDYVMRLPDSTFPADEEYVFRRRTERDRLATLTPPADARRWHRLLADWLDSQPETRSHEEYLELLAEQREQSGALDSAASVYLEAAGQARAHRAPKREVAFYERALALLGDDGPSRRLTALLRAAELHEEGGNAALALERYREAATLAFRLDRRRLWETARLAMSRVIEAHATRIASHPAPKPPVSAVVPVAPPAHTPGPLPAISDGWPPTVVQARAAPAAAPVRAASVEPLPAAPAAPPVRAVSAEPLPRPIDDRLTPVVAYPLPPTVAEPMPAPQAVMPVDVADTMTANATAAEPTSAVPTSAVPTSTEGPASGQDIDLVQSAPSIPAEPAAEVASPAAQAEPGTAPAIPEPSVLAASPAESSPAETEPSVEAASPAESARAESSPAETASVEKPPAAVEPAPPSPTPDPPDVSKSDVESSAAEATERKPSESQAELPSEPTVGSAEPSPNETST